MQWISREITKPAYKGLASIPDLPVVLGNLLASGINKFVGTDIPQGKLPSEYVGDAVDYATGGLSQGEPTTALGKGVEFASSMASGGGAAKLLKEGSKAAAFTGSTKPADIATAGAMGATTQALENQGVDATTSSIAGLGVGMSPTFIWVYIAKDF